MAVAKKAHAEGVVEKSAEPEGLVLVMIPKREAIAGSAPHIFYLRTPSHLVL